MTHGSIPSTEVRLLLPLGTFPDLDSSLGGLNTKSFTRGPFPLPEEVFLPQTLDLGTDGTGTGPGKQGSGGERES